MIKLGYVALTVDPVADGAVFAFLAAGAAVFQVQDYWCRGAIPSVHYFPSS
jgi:hypothetical protein